MSQLAISASIIITMAVASVQRFQSKGLWGAECLKQI
jgi:hypothetical protein